MKGWGVQLSIVISLLALLIAIFVGIFTEKEMGWTIFGLSILFLAVLSLATTGKG